MKIGKEQKEVVEHRCAIYVRKSTTENLDMDFNSLDAQREACEAYIKSQQSEGWTAIEANYSDGGFSGGNMDRPGFKQLMADIEADLVDIVVVYKVDRLSRSLMDFSRIVQVFEKRNVSFVSVTQQFNTTNSMGRLTLNILLSFAQFERELISERTSDKMSAARRKGKWVGGMPMLGYDVAPTGGKLVINEAEALRVQEIYQLYIQKRSLLDTARELNARSWTTKTWRTKKGTIHEGRPFNKTNLYSLLKNVVFTGKIAHRGEIYEGEHEAIIDEDTYNRVQAIMRHNGSTGGVEARNKYGALLRGILFCEHCDTIMFHSYAQKKSRRYRYYVCEHANKFGWDTCPNKSLPAAEIENFVVEQVKGLGGNEELFAATLKAIREQQAEKKALLDSERRSLEKKWKMCNEEINRLIAALGSEADEVIAPRLVKMQESVRAIESDLHTVKRRAAKLEMNNLDEEDLRKSVGQFDLIWDALSAKEQSRVINLLIERVGWDGERGKVLITYRADAMTAFENEETETTEQEQRI